MDGVSTRSLPIIQPADDRAPHSRGADVAEGARFPPGPPLRGVPSGRTNRWHGPDRLRQSAGLPSAGPTCQRFCDFESPSLRHKKAALRRLQWRREGDSNPRYWLTQYTRLAGEPDRPLRHLSKASQITVGGRLAQGFLPRTAPSLQDGGTEGWPSGLRQRS